MRAFTVIVNPASGRGKTTKLLPRLGPAFEALGLDAEIVVSRSPSHPPELALDALDRGRVAVACGGDGLASAVVAAAADAGGTAAIIPTGSGNDFARNLGLDHKHPLAALSHLASGPVQKVDLGKVNGRWFCCVASAGFDAEANRWANERTRLGGTALYVAATLRTLAVYRPQPFRLTVDGQAHDLEAWLLAVGNATSYGGGMKVTPAARLDDGMLDATVVGPVSKLEFIRTFPRVFSGTHIENPKVSTFRGSAFTLESSRGDALPVFADGEHAADLPARIEAVPRAVSVIVPETGLN